tara:strand:- start:2491 stop:2880 length:390 start_codon:yes stop_codon:yes gene_type:complete
MTTSEENYDGGYEATPSVGDMLLTNTRSEGDVVKELIETSNDASKWIPRSRVTAKERKENVRILTLENFINTGKCSADELTWLDAAFSIAEDGKGRREAVEMVTGHPEHQVIPRLRSKRNRFERQEKTL